MPGINDLIKKVNPRQHIARYDRDGIFADPPKEQPDIVAKIRNVQNAGDQEIGELLAYCTAWMSYLSTEIGILDSQISVIVGFREIAESRIMRDLEIPYLNSGGKKRLVESMRGEIYADNLDIFQARQDEIDLSARLKVAKGFYDAFTAQYTSISRELTRRGMGFSADSRSAKVF